MPCPIIEIGDSFPKEAREDFRCVAGSVRHEIDALFQNADPPLVLPITCELEASPRVTLDSWSNATRITIHIDTDPNKRFYSQFVFQLAHEIGHVFCGPHRTNFAIETIVTAISLTTLTNVAQQWAKSPPYESWRSYSQNLQTYRQDHERKKAIAGRTIDH
jgi:hypothetical protein